jgi:hypothetical protein
LAPAGILTLPLVPTATMLLSVTTTTALLMGAAPVPSIKRDAFKTMVPFPTGASGRICGGGTCEYVAEMETQIRTNARKKIFGVFTNDASADEMESRGILTGVRG